MKKPRSSLSFILLSSLAALLLLSWLLLSIISTKTHEQSLYDEKSEAARLLLDSIVILLEVGDRPSVAGVVARLASERDIGGIEVVTKDGTAVYVHGRKVLSPVLLPAVLQGQTFSGVVIPGTISRFAPLYRNNAIAGAVALTVSLGPEQEKISKTKQLFVAYFILDFLLLLGLGGFLLSRMVVSPIQKLVVATKKIAEGDLNLRIHGTGSTEIDELSEAFNRMAEALRLKSDEARHHVESLEKSNRDLQEARTEAIMSEKLASVGILAAGMAHEIGSPLAAVMGYADMLRHELGDNAEAADFINRISESCGKIDRTVRELLSYARPRPAEIEELDFHSFLADTFRMLNAQGVFKIVTASFYVQPDIAPLRTDRHQLQQVLTNLAINARDSMPHGGEFRVNVVQEGAQIVMRVRDTGVGIPPSQVERIFDPFFTTKDPGKGTGLGLSISARIIDSFGGTIAAANGNPGAIFTIRLPINPEREDHQDE